MLVKIGNYLPTLIVLSNSYRTDFVATGQRGAGSPPFGRQADSLSDSEALSRYRLFCWLGQRFLTVFLSYNRP